MGRLSAGAGAGDAPAIGPAARARLEAWLDRALGASGVAVEGSRPLGGGAIQENLALTLRVPGRATALEAVLRRDAPATIAESRSRAEEHALLGAARSAGVAVPRPLAFCDDPEVLGAPFSLAERVAGVALGQRVVKDRRLGGDREALVARLGAELAAIHAIDPTEGSLGFLAHGRAPDVGAAPVRAIDRVRGALDALGAVRPALEAGLRRLELAPPASAAETVLHRDFRTGNLMLDEGGLVAVLDWEFVGLGDPMEDLGWFCARCWRFSRPELEAGGLGSRGAFYDGYERASGRRVDDAAVRWWEAFAHARWAAIALQQAARHDSGRERSLALALTGRIADALELRLLDATSDGADDGAGVGTGSGDASAAEDRSRGNAPEGDAPDTDPARIDPRRRAAADLLDTAREALEGIARRADAADRLECLMGASAAGTVARELACADSGERLRRAVLEAARTGASDEAVRGIRAGRHDADAALDAALLRETALRAWISRPAEVDAGIRARRGLRSGGGPPA